MKVGVADWEAASRWVVTLHPLPLLLHARAAAGQDATYELLQQYEAVIEGNLPKRQALAGFIGNLDSLLRAALVSLAAWCLMRAYTGGLVKILHLKDLLGP